MKHFIAFISMLCWSVAGLAGEVGNGVDYYRAEAGNLWFHDSDRPVHYCTVISPQFGVSVSFIDQAFQAAVKTWRTYFENKGIGVKTSFNFISNAKCDGTEDLKLYLGTIDDTVRPVWIQHNNPIGISYQQSYDQDAHWAKGFIWISLASDVPATAAGKLDWSLSLNLQGIFTHEMGHILGCGHVQGTVMDADFANFFSTTGKDPSIRGGLFKWILAENFI